MYAEITNKKLYNINDLLQIMQLLRSENGCPWDKEQTHASIRKNLLEETYEVAEAIDLCNDDLLKEELGDLLLQIVFHAQIAAEDGTFAFDNVCNDICKKLIVRHPHIFSNVVAGSSAEVLHNWEEIKKQQKGQKTATDTLQSVPKTLPALMRSQKIQARAAKAGFDYPTVAWALNDLKSEVEELEAAIKSSNKENQCEELGDLIFSVVNVSRFLGHDAEEALSLSCEKFMHRFKQVERIAAERGTDIAKSSIEELNALWYEAKKCPIARDSLGSL